VKSERFNTDRPGLCTSLRWKSQYIWSDPDPDVPACNDGLFWCGNTQTCIGPDGKLAEQATAAPASAAAIAKTENEVIEPLIYADEYGL